jgi:Rod binding domain-containing protein
MDVNLTLMNPLPPSTAGEVLSGGKAANAATQFEGLMIAQLLKASHEEGTGWLGSGDDATAGQANAIAEEFLAQALASKGGLGIARMVNANLAKSDGKPQSTAAQGSPSKAL